MSKNNNVNPGQYKVAGRERPGEDINAPVEKAELKENQVKQTPPGPGGARTRQQDDTDARDHS
ncbi:MAG TPA: hypothetical protein VMF13_15915 [Luteitalea sp.]|nr:hypothetical protein [Luteitalea sp.]